MRRRPFTITVALAALAVLAVACSSQEPASVTYFIEDGDASAGFRESDRQLAEWALGAWAAESDTPLELLAVPEAEASIRIRWVRANQGLYGEARMTMVDGRAVADVYVRPDIRGLGADIEAEAARDPLFRDTIVYLTCVHEIGHAFGLGHTADFADIMYTFQYGGDFVAYFRRFRDQIARLDEIPTASPFSAADRRAFRSR